MRLEVKRLDYSIVLLWFAGIFLGLSGLTMYILPDFYGWIGTLLFIGSIAWTIFLAGRIDSMHERLIKL